MRKATMMPGSPDVSPQDAHELVGARREVDANEAGQRFGHGSGAFRGSPEVAPASEQAPTVPDLRRWRRRSASSPSNRSRAACLARHAGNRRARRVWKVISACGFMSWARRRYARPRDLRAGSRFARRLRVGCTYRLRGLRRVMIFARYGRVRREGVEQASAERSLGVLADIGSAGLPARQQ